MTDYKKIYESGNSEGVFYFDVEVLSLIPSVEKIYDGESTKLILDKEEFGIEYVDGTVIITGQKLSELPDDIRSDFVNYEQTPNIEESTIKGRRPLVIKPVKSKQ